jgi:hypothetical protein
MYKGQGRNNALNGVDGEQYTNTCMSTFNEVQRRRLVADQDVSGVQTYALPTKGTHHSAIQPAPDPVKLDLNLSPLGGEQISAPISKFSSDLHADAIEQEPSVKRFSAVERDPKVKRFSADVDQTEFRQVVQGQLASPVVNRKDKLMEWLVYVYLQRSFPLDSKKNQGR